MFSQEYRCMYAFVPATLLLSLLFCVSFPCLEAFAVSLFVVALWVLVTLPLAPWDGRRAK
jgi:Zn-dependent protease